MGRFNFQMLKAALFALIGTASAVKSYIE